MTDYIQDDSNQEEFDLNQQEPQGEVIQPDGEIWDPPCTDTEGD